MVTSRSISWPLRAGCEGQVKNKIALYLTNYFSYERSEYESITYGPF